MNQREAFDRGVMAGILLILAANAIYWFISVWSPEVSLTKTLLLGVQALVCLGGAIGLFIQRRRYPRR